MNDNSGKDQDRFKGALEQDDRTQTGNNSMQGQLGHRDQDPMLKSADTDFPEPGENAEHSGGRTTRTASGSQLTRTSAEPNLQEKKRPPRGGRCFLRTRLPQLFHRFFEHFASRTDHRFRQSRQWLIDQIQHVDKAGRFRVEIKHAGQHVSLGVRLHQPAAPPRSDWSRHRSLPVYAAVGASRRAS